MFTLAVNSNNDIYLTNGNLTIANEMQAIEQACKQATSTLVKELIYNQTAGIDYLNKVWNSRNLQTFQNQIVSAIKSIPNVISVIDFKMDQKGSGLSYVAKISTIYGGTTINGRI